MLAIRAGLPKSYNIQLEAAEIFLGAAKYIRQYGWQVSGMGVYGSPRCSMGALASANPQSEWNKEMSRLMYERLSSELKGETLTQFNKRVKNGESVALLFEKVAHSLLANTPY